jgi:hypothetical protein
MELPPIGIVCPFCKADIHVMRGVDAAVNQFGCVGGAVFALVVFLVACGVVYVALRILLG